MILLSIVTLGIWTIVWSFQNGDELKRRRGTGLGGVAYLFITLLISPVTMFLMASEVEQMYRDDGKEPPITTIWGLWFLLPLIGNLIWYVRIQGAAQRLLGITRLDRVARPLTVASGRYVRGQTPDVTVVRRRSIAANAKRHPTMKNPRNSVATMMNAVAVPSSNTK